MKKILDSNMTHSIVYGNKTIDFTLSFRKRKTLEIAVHPDCSVVVKAPIRAGITTIEKKIARKAPWIFKQLHYFTQFHPKTPPRCYVSGETHLYLGKQYRLKITKGSHNKVLLSRGFFHITSRSTPTPEIVETHLYQWYHQKAQQQFVDILDHCWQTHTIFGNTKPSLSIRRMKTKWGSLSSTGKMTLNLDLIRAPKKCIEYVILHELCHLIHRNHSSAFYALLSTVSPDWKKTKHALELSTA